MGSGRRRRKRRSRSNVWWRQQYGGMPVWGLGLALVALIAAVAIAVPAALTPPQRSEAAPRPLPSMFVPEKKPVAAFIGDSYTAGAGSPQGGFVKLVATEQGWLAKNLGRGGTGFTQNTDQDPENSRVACGLDYCESYPEMIPAAAKLDPAVVVVSGGRNGVGVDPDRMQTAVDSFFTTLRDALPDAQIIVTSPLWDDEETPAWLDDLASMERAAAESVGAVYLDIGQPLEGREDLVADDGIHPNQEGHAEIARVVNAALSS